MVVRCGPGTVVPRSGAVCTDILNFSARVLVIRAAKGREGSASLIPKTDLRLYPCDVRSRVLPASRSDTLGVEVRPQSERRSTLDDHAAASTNGHVARKLATWRIPARTRAHRCSAVRVGVRILPAETRAWDRRRPIDDRPLFAGAPCVNGHRSRGQRTHAGVDVVVFAPPSR